MNTDLMTSKAVAEYLGVHMNTIARLCGTYKLPHVRLTKRCIRFQKSEVDAWVRSRRVTGPKEHQGILKEASNG